jgi:hypothetical protein
MLASAEHTVKRFPRKVSACGAYDGGEQGSLAELVENLLKM